MGHPVIVPAPTLAAVTRGRSRLARVWFALLLAAICFEGLGRKVLPDVPSSVFYFMKDAVLLIGLAAFGVRRGIARTTSVHFGAFSLVLVAAVGWTVIQVFNPIQTHLGLAVIGLRSYWLWWIAPLVIASALHGESDRRAGIGALILVAGVVVAYATVQFASSPDAALNAYASHDPDQITGPATVATTGRARVASTFAYLSGLTDFLVLMPTLLIALALGDQSRRLRVAGVAAGMAAAAAVPLTGSRGPLVLAAVGVAIVVWGAGFLATRAGRRAFWAGAIAVAVAVLTMPVAVEGVRDRFRGQDTAARVAEFLQVLPPVALVANEYPLLGDGTGMQHNARLALGVESPWNTESETSRLLVELGPFGYLLVWTARLGLAVGLLRAARSFRQTGRRAVAGGAVAFAFFAIVGNLAFDHVWQALFFVGVGFFLGEACRGGRGTAVTPKAAAERR